MIHFSERIAITYGYHCFLNQHPGMADDPLSLLAFMQNENLLNEEAIKEYISVKLGEIRNANIDKKD